MRNINASPRMKYSHFISPNTKKFRENRESEPALIIHREDSESRPDTGTKNINFQPNQLGSSIRFSNRVYPQRASPEKQDKKNNIQSLMTHLKMNYPRLSEKPRIKRVKSQELDLVSDTNTRTKTYKASIVEIQDKLARYSRNNPRSREHSPLRSNLSIMKSQSKLDKATQKCKKLCHDLKKKVLKETVSTIAPEPVEKERNIKQFSLGKLLGQGKFSKVYLARHRRSGLLVALKIIKKETIKKENFSNQLAREIVTQSFFNHVNLVKLFGHFADEANVYLIMEYCPGGQLYDIFKVKSKLSEEEWAPIMKGICEGLFSLHLNDVIHRDLKPENILLAYGLPKIGDFGWVVYSPGDRRDTFCGTPLYISPELLMGGSYNKQVDIWALGVMMYEYVTGRIPFKLNQNKKFAQIVNQKIEFPDNLGAKCLNLLKMILNKDPSSRICIMDVLEHPYLKHCLSGSTSTSGFLRLGY